MILLFFVVDERFAFGVELRALTARVDKLTLLDDFINIALVNLGVGLLADAVVGELLDFLYLGGSRVIGSRLHVLLLIRGFKPGSRVADRHSCRLWLKRQLLLFFILVLFAQPLHLAPLPLSDPILPLQKLIRVQLQLRGLLLV